MFQRFDEECKKVLKRAKIEMQDMKHPFVGSEHLLLSILSFNNLKVCEKLKEHNIFYDKFKKELIETIGIGSSLNSYFIYTPMLKRVIENAIIDTKEDGILEVSVSSLFVSLLEEGEGVAIRILNNLGINIDELIEEFKNKDDEFIKYKNKKKLSILEQGVDLCKNALEGKIEPVIGRDDEINRMIEILLRKNKNNPLLIGDAGVGKTAIVEGLALKIVNKEVPEFLFDKKIISISMANLVAGTKYRGEFEEKINKIIKEIENNSNLIIFIDEIHSLVGAGGAEGAIDASNIFKPALARGKFKLIGATTNKEYKESIEKDKALNRRFQTILITEPDLEETNNILLKIKPIYEKYHNVYVPNEIINKIVNLADQYIFDKKNPDKSIDILDEICIIRALKKDKTYEKIKLLKKEYENNTKEKNKYIINHDFIEATKRKEKENEIEDKINKLCLKNKKNSQKVVSLDDLYKVIQNKSRIPIYEIDKDAIKKVNELENYLKTKIIGQEEAINTLCYETKKIKLGIKDTKTPLSFLFTGKSGIGKTSLAKEYASFLKMNLIRIDASEYMENHSISKIIGSPPGYVGYDVSNTILDDIKKNPYSIVLIDEIEKASSSFINLFLQILDEGFITNSNLEKVYFNHTIIIMTSNVTDNGNIGFMKENNKIKNKLSEVFKIEFINRINHIIQFNEMSYENIKEIIKNEITSIKKKFKTQGINLSFDNNIIDEVIDLSNYTTSGARKIKKVLIDKVDDIVIDNMLNGIFKINIKTIKEKI